LLRKVGWSELSSQNGKLEGKRARPLILNGKKAMDPNNPTCTAWGWPARALPILSHFSLSFVRKEPDVLTPVVTQNKPGGAGHTLR